MRDRSEDQIRLVFVRHGATKSNREHRYLGRGDESLSEEGREMLLDDKRQGCYPAVDILFSSPMKRCLQTAGLLYPEQKPVCIAEWTEIDFGAFEGKNYEELKGDERYQRWIDSGGRLPFPGGESREEFILRCERGFERMLSELERRKEEKAARTLGIIAHGGTIMALLSRYGGGDYFDYQAANGKGYVCRCSRKGSRIELSRPEKIG